MKRRDFLFLPAGLALATRALADSPGYPNAVSGHKLEFPRDYGAHPLFQTEWWYATGWLHASPTTRLGFQVAFFRSRLASNESNTSRFAPTQLLFANAAVGNPQAGQLQIDQRGARSGFGLAEASVGDTNILIDDWSLRRDEGGRYRANIASRYFAFALTMQPTQAIMLNGVSGHSSKGPHEGEASYYYSEPQLRVSGTLRRKGEAGGKPEPVEGRAWLDHEWMSGALRPGVAGWDWVGINLDDGGAVMAFQIRDGSGRRFWAGATLRDGDGTTRTLAPKNVDFTPLRWWRSPRTGARYPVAVRIDIDALSLLIVPAFDDQEFDGRACTGTVYWEGAVTAFKVATKSSATDPVDPAGPPGDKVDAVREVAKVLGRGYLELTGYFQRLDQM